MQPSDAMLLEWAKRTGCTFEYLESLSRGGYFDDIQPEQVDQYLALIELTRQWQDEDFCFENRLELYS